VDLRDAKSLRELAEEAPVIDFVNQIFAEARARDASDIHVEPFEDHMAIRLRIDGVLVLWRTAPRAQFEAVSSRIKLLSGIDIAERRLPQDGRQRIRAGGQDIDLRVSTLPTRWGESVVLRVLGNTRDLPDFDGLGLAGDHQALLHSMMQRTNGVILVTGPTGSGKTTTVYRILSALNDGARKIVTVEDPVEMNLPGVMQMQANSDIGLDFAAGLRAMLRQDPDVIFVGEIRDVETARTAVQAALTGHLVISTVHTNSALSAVWRLMDLGVEPFLVAEAVSGVVAQRLIRRLCSHCAAPDPGAEDAPARQRLGRWVQGVAPQWRKATGCARCAGQGLKGRIGVYEMIAIDATLRDAIRTRASEQTLREIAANHGMRFLGEDALMKARAGLCSSADAQKLSV
jgi:general secretion pathway protein E